LNGNEIDLFYADFDPRIASLGLPSVLAADIDSDQTTLDVVRDASGRALVFHHVQTGVLNATEVQFNSLITSVTGYDPQGTDLQGLSIQYFYDEVGNLTRVLRKDVVPGGQPQPNEIREEKYEYTKTDIRDRHNLLAYTDPNLHTTQYVYYGQGGPLLPLPGFAPEFGVASHEFVHKIIEPATTDPDGVVHAGPVTEFCYEAPTQ